MATDEVSRCPLCGWEARVAHLGDADRVNCALCGEFKITRSLLRTALADREAEETKSLLPYLSAHTCQATERGEIVTLNTANWKDLALAHKETPVSRKLTKLLELIGSRSNPPGTQVSFNKAADAPLVDAANATEFSYLLEQLDELGYVRAARDFTYVIKARGWEQLQSNVTRGTPGKCFVAMSFDDSLKEAYQSGIYLAVNDCGMEPVRIDLIHHNEKICDRIIAEIRTCQFLVVDVTLQRAGVYFEAGFAMGLGRDVIWMCRDDDLKNVHFDTRQYNHIVWQSPEDLRAKLADRIRATIPGAA